jgi:flagellar motor switch protein FliG
MHHRPPFTGMWHSQRFNPPKIAVVLAVYMTELQESRASYFNLIPSALHVKYFKRSIAAIAILEKIEGENSSLALSIRNLMFVFDNVMLIDDSGMRELLQRDDKYALTIALKGTREELKNRFFRNMSSRAVEMMKEDMDVLGPVKVRDVEIVQK